MSDGRSPEAALTPAPVATMSGLSPRAAACLAYAMWWVSGAVMLVVEPSHPFVRFHARQALRVFGVIWLAGVGCWALSFMLVFVWPPGFRVAAVLGQVVFSAGVVAWLACLVAAWRGQRWMLPWLGRRLRLDR